MRTKGLISQNDAALNETRVKALAQKYGDKTPFVALAALGALTQYVQPEHFAEVLMVAELAVLFRDDKGHVGPLKETGSIERDNTG
jgi:hypothetical protein